MGKCIESFFSRIRKSGTRGDRFKLSGEQFSRKPRGKLFNSEGGISYQMNSGGRFNNNILKTFGQYVDRKGYEPSMVNWDQLEWGHLGQYG